jgi:hypothetical protein
VWIFNIAENGSVYIFGEKAVDKLVSARIGVYIGCKQSFSDFVDFYMYLILIIYLLEMISFEKIL